MQNSKPLLVVYHGSCADGFGAAWAIHKAELAGRVTRGVEYVKGTYGYPAPDVQGRDLVLVDFCYPPQVMEELVAMANTVLVLDHHVSAQKDMAALAERLGWRVYAGVNHDGGATIMITDYLTPEGKTAKVEMCFDMNRSGAAMAWDHFNNHTHWPTLIKYVQDRDLWTKVLPHIDEFTLALGSYDMDFATWDKIAARVEFSAINNPQGLAQFYNEGSSILRYQRNLVDQAVKASFWVTLQAPRGLFDGASTADSPLPNVPINSWRVRATNCIPALASEVGEVLAERFGGIGLTWIEGKDQLLYSLRSRGDNAPDVSLIAKAFGGGGHAKAAGFKSSHNVHIKEFKDAGKIVAS